MGADIAVLVLNKEVTTATPVAGVWDAREEEDGTEVN